MVGTALIEAVDYICFTGSTGTGRTVGEQAGRRLIGASLELGGKNPLIVRKDADLKKAAEGCAAAAFANTGQMCIHIERVLVDESVYDEFRSALVAATQALRVGQTFDYTVDVGSLASADQLATVDRHVEQARRPGPRCSPAVAPGPTSGRSSTSPPCSKASPPRWRCAARRPSGRSSRSTPRLGPRGGRSSPTGAATASRPASGAATCAPPDSSPAQVRAGSVNINDGAAAAAASVEAPMGGMGDSGLGRRHGAEGIRRYTEAQTVAVQRLLPLGRRPALGVESSWRSPTASCGCCADCAFGEHL